MFGEIDQKPQPPRADGESLYRTQWLMAHNALHTLVHDGGDPQAIFDDYLRNLQNAEVVASQPA
jgi:hypothetical protein